MLTGLTLDDNGTMPDFGSARSNGIKPFVVTGDYPAQLRWAVNYLAKIDLEKESVFIFLMFCYAFIITCQKLK